MMFCAVLGLLGGAGSASAHAALLSTDPGQGAVLASMPTTVSLSFSESVIVGADGVRVFGPDGAELDDGHPVHLGRSSTVGVGLSTGQPPQGTYTVSWRVISADSHPVAGAFAFSVGHPSTGRTLMVAQPSGSTAVGVSYAITRAAAFACYALLVGSIAFVLLCWPDAIADRGVRRVMLTGWAGLLTTTVATLLLQGPYGNGLGVERVLDSMIISETLTNPLGTAVTARLILLALAGSYLVLLCAWFGHLARRGRLWFGAIGVALALGVAGTWAGADHAATGLQPELALPADIVHLLTMAVWLGGLATLVILLRPAATPDVEVLVVPDRAVARFSSIATGSIMVLLGTGSYQSWRQLGSWSAFSSTDYGRLLLVKLGAFALMLSVAALSHRWVRQHRRTLIGVGAAMPAASRTQRGAVRRCGGQQRSALRRSIVGEAALGALVLGVTALLINAEPGRTATAKSPAPVHRVVNYDTGGSDGRGKLLVDVDPAASGSNRIRVLVQDPAGSRHDVAELRTTLTLAARRLGPLAIPLRHTEPGGYDASSVQLPFPGSWQMKIIIRTSDFDETTVAVPINVR